MTMYKLTFANGKSYIGITSTSLHRRLVLHRSHAKTLPGGHLQRAIRKYGFCNVTVEVLGHADDWSSLCEMEKEAIVKFNTVSPNGYNMTLGGDGQLGGKFNVGRPCGEEKRNKIAFSQKGRTFSEEHKNKLSAARTGRKFAPHSEECKLKISSSMQGKNKVGHPSVFKGKGWSEARRKAYENKRSVYAL